MDPDLARNLRALLAAQRVASLGTLHQGEPYVSMVPFAIVPGSADFIVHVSALAAHTRDMLAHPAVSLLVMAEPSADVPPQALARVTIQGDAEQLVEPGPHERARDAYLARFPGSAQTFELADFSLFAIRPRSARFVGGFAQAKTVTPQTLAAILGSP
jgi:putative heme iron utilization protein